MGTLRLGVNQRHRLRLGLELGLGMELDLRPGLGLGLHMEMCLALRLNLGARRGLPGRQRCCAPVAGLELDLEMNGVVTGGDTYPDDTQALMGSSLVMSSSNEDRESISRLVLLTFSLGCGGSCMGASGPPSSTSRGSGERKIFSLKVQQEMVSRLGEGEVGSHLPEHPRHHWPPQAWEEAVRESLLGVAGESCPPGPSVHIGPQQLRKAHCHQAGNDSLWALGPPPAELLRGIKNWSRDGDHVRWVEGRHG